MNNANLSSLRERIVIYRKQRSVTAHGYVTNGYALDRNAWASVVGYSAQYVEGKLEDTNEIRYKVILRFEHSDLHAKDRCLYRGRMLEFITEPVAVEGKREYVFLTARELVEDEKKKNLDT